MPATVRCWHSKSLVNLTLTRICFIKAVFLSLERRQIRECFRFLLLLQIRFRRSTPSWRGSWPENTQCESGPQSPLSHAQQHLYPTTISLFYLQDWKCAPRPSQNQEETLHQFDVQRTLLFFSESSNFLLTQKDRLNWWWGPAHNSRRFPLFSLLKYGGGGGGPPDPLPSPLDYYVLAGWRRLRNDKSDTRRVN